MTTTSTKRGCIRVYMKLYEEVMQKLGESLDKRGEKARVSRIMETAPNTLTRWFQEDEKGKRSPSGAMLMSALDAVGARVVFPGDKTEGVSCVTQEAAAIDRLIVAMRESGEASDSAIKAALLKKVEEELFEKKPNRNDSEERRLAS